MATRTTGTCDACHSTSSNLTPPRQLPEDESHPYRYCPRCHKNNRAVLRHRRQPTQLELILVILTALAVLILITFGVMGFLRLNIPI